MAVEEKAPGPPPPPPVEPPGGGGGEGEGGGGSSSSGAGGSSSSSGGSSGGGSSAAPPDPYTKWYTDLDPREQKRVSIFEQVYTEMWGEPAPLPVLQAAVNQGLNRWEFEEAQMRNPAWWRTEGAEEATDPYVALLEQLGITGRRKKGGKGKGGGKDGGGKGGGGGKGDKPGGPNDGRPLADQPGPSYLGPPVRRRRG